jgi:hypothetical protein
MFAKWPHTRCSICYHPEVRHSEGHTPSKSETRARTSRATVPHSNRSGSTRGCGGVHNHCPRRLALLPEHCLWQPAALLSPPADILRPQQGTANVGDNGSRELPTSILVSLQTCPCTPSHHCVLCLQTYLMRTTFTHTPPLHHITPFTRTRTSCINPAAEPMRVESSGGNTVAGGGVCRVPDSAARLEADQRVPGRRRQPAQCVGAQQPHRCDRSVRGGQDPSHLSPDHAVGTDQGVELRLGDCHHASFGTCSRCSYHPCATCAHITLAQHALTSP